MVEKYVQSIFNLPHSISAKGPRKRSSRWQHVIGIVGGMGPYAHIELERQLLLATAEMLSHPPRDQDYPAWRLSSFPATPDRTRALLGVGRSPVPWLERSVRSLAAGRRGVRADFVVMACITAHAFLEDVQRQVSIPVLDMVDETLRDALSNQSPTRIGLLATTGTLQSDIYQAAADRVGSGVRIVSLLDVEDRGRPGEWLQEHLVMEPVYGPLRRAARTGGGLKSGALTGAPAREAAARFSEAVSILARGGAELVILGCTEIPVVLGEGEIEGVGLLDPLAVTARAAIEIASGARPLPSVALSGVGVGA